MQAVQAITTYLFENWEFLLNLFLAFVALAIGIKALRSSRKVEEAVLGDESYISVQWYKLDERTHCNLRALGEISNASLQVAQETKRLDNLESSRSQIVVFPFLERGTRWALKFTDPATAKVLHRRGLVRYD